MANYQWEVASNLERQQWGDKIWMEAEKKDPMKKFEGESIDSVIQIKTSLKAGGAGQHEDFDFLLDLAGGGLTASDTRASGLAAFSSATGLAASSSYGADALGNLSDQGSTWGDKTAFTVDSSGYGKILGREEIMKIRTDRLVIGRKKHGIRESDQWINQLYMDRFREKAKTLLGKWMADYRVMTRIKHLCGVTTWAFPEAAKAPTTSDTYEMNRHLFGGDATAKGELHEGCFFTVEELDRLRELADVSVPKIKPYTTEDGEEMYPVLLHPYQARTLRADTKWHEAHMFANDRGSKNPIFTGALYKYNGLLLYEHPWMPIFSDGGASGSLNYARAILMGLNAGCIHYSEEPDYREDVTSSEADAGESPGLLIFDNLGFKKTQVLYDGTNAVDIGVIAMDTYYTTATGTSHIS